MSQKEEKLEDFYFSVDATAMRHRHKHPAETHDCIFAQSYAQTPRCMADHVVGFKTPSCHDDFSLSLFVLSLTLELSLLFLSLSNKSCHPQPKPPCPSSSIAALHSSVLPPAPVRPLFSLLLYSLSLSILTPHTPLPPTHLLVTRRHSSTRSSTPPLFSLNFSLNISVHSTNPNHHTTHRCCLSHQWASPDPLPPTHHCHPFHSPPSISISFSSLKHLDMTNQCLLNTTRTPHPPPFSNDFLAVSTRFGMGVWIWVFALLGLNLGYHFITITIAPKGKASWSSSTPKKHSRPFSAITGSASRPPAHHEVIVTIPAP